MAFKIENIDRAIEWAIRDEIISRGYWPDQRAFIASDDESGFNTALDAMTTRIDVFGVGNFKDREQLRVNNVIIDREDITDGDIGYSQPYRFDLQSDFSFKKIRTAQGTSHLEYEVRFVCDNVALDREINMIMIKSIGRRTFVYGINDDLTNMDEGFWIERNGPPVDMSDKDFIERVFRFIVKDVVLDEEEDAATGIKPITQIIATRNIPSSQDYDVQFPEKEDDGAAFTLGAVDFFLGLVQNLSGWRKFDVARLYALDTQVNALKNLKGNSSAVNSGLTFAPWKGFKKTGAGQYLDTQFSPFRLTDYSYAVFVTEAPSVGVMELFGLIDSGGSSFYLRSDATSGFQAKGNGDTQVQLTTKVKANTLYVLNCRNRFRFEIFEGDVIIGELELEPTAIPEGRFAELNIFNDLAAPVGVSTGGGLGFSAIGAGLKGIEIRDLNAALRVYFSKVGVIPLS